MLIKTALLSALLCLATCSDALTAASLPEEETVGSGAEGSNSEASNSNTADAAAAPDEATPEADAPAAPKIIFKQGVGDSNSGKVDNKAPEAANLPVADWIIVDKSDRMLVLYRRGKEIKRYANIRFGDAPMGHKRFQGDERTPEGTYTIDARNPNSSYHLSLRISYPNAADRAYARALGRDPGGDIFIHGQPNGYTGPAKTFDWTDGCIALSNAEMREIWQMVPDGAQITIQQ